MQYPYIQKSTNASEFDFPNQIISTLKPFFIFQQNSKFPIDYRATTKNNNPYFSQVHFELKYIFNFQQNHLYPQSQNTWMPNKLNHTPKIIHFIQSKIIHSRIQEKSKFIFPAKYEQFQYQIQYIQSIVYQNDHADITIIQFPIFITNNQFFWRDLSSNSSS